MPKKIGRAITLEQAGGSNTNKVVPASEDDLSSSDLNKKKSPELNEPDPFTGSYIFPDNTGGGFQGRADSPAWRVKIRSKLPGLPLNNLAYINSGQVPLTFWKLADSSGNILNGVDPYNGLSVTAYDTAGYDIPNESAAVDTSVIKYNFNRNGSSVSGLDFSIRLKINYDITTNGQKIDETEFDLIHTFSNSSDSRFTPSGTPYNTTTSEGLAQYCLALLSGSGSMLNERTGVNVDPSRYVNITQADGSTAITSPENSGNNYFLHVTPNPRNRWRRISGSIHIKGDVFMKKFDQLPAYQNDKIDIITKDFDMGFPGIRKKVYKVILTYKAPYAMHVEEEDLRSQDETEGETENTEQSRQFTAYSNVTPTYALNGAMKLRTDNNYDWKTMSVFNLASNASLYQVDTYVGTTLFPAGSPIPGSVNPVWIRQELIPYEGSQVWTSVYSIALRLSSIGPTKGFELNDISIVYRLKGIK